MMRWQPAWTVAGAVCLLAAALSCSSGEAPASRAPQGSLMDDRIAFELAVYYLNPPASDPIADLDRRLAADFQGRLQRGKAAPRTVTARLITDVQAAYPPPSLDMLSYRGEGLDAGQADALQRAPAVLVLDFSHGKEHVWDGLRDAIELVGGIARDAGGLVWDREESLVLTPEAWAEKIPLAAWQAGTVPDCRQLVTIDDEQGGEYHREVTRGMKKLGLPDIVAANLSPAVAPSMGNLINALIQSLAEGSVQTMGESELSLHSLQNPEVRAALLRQVLGQGKGEGRLVLTRVDPQEGDPDNRLIEIGFGRYPGNDLHARQEALIVGFWGAEKDEITHVDHNAEVLAASAKARARLPALHAAFDAGLEPGERLLVKAPFARPGGGNEWMWVEVISWKDGTIRGSLQNEPYEVPGLQVGQEVEVAEKDVLDYIRRLPDGRMEGNWTAESLRSQSQD
jgi:uncharacterized protein YegJ (DUF2314 family)